MKYYKVGGYVRDSMLGLLSKDVDYTCVVNFEITVEAAFEMMHKDLIEKGYEIFLSTPEMHTIRAKSPVGKEVADFVLARKEVGYVEGTRRPILELGTLEDDLYRRDFTVNAMALDEEGHLIDPFGGEIDLMMFKTLRTPKDPINTLNDDPLRILRALRFHVTKGFKLSHDLHHAIKNFNYTDKMYVVSEERIREELYKCFKVDTLKTLYLFDLYPELKKYIFTKTKLWLKPTNEL